MNAPRVVLLFATAFLGGVALAVAEHHGWLDSLPRWMLPGGGR
ncbi:MAG TPA: hypothetical protein VG265_05825 [Gaiellaceae bacterium]|nr:hypothetical protein [Gaiellaceae bacterium]